MTSVFARSCERPPAADDLAGAASSARAEATGTIFITLRSAMAGRCSIDTWLGMLPRRSRPA